MNENYDFKGSVKRVEQRTPWCASGLEDLPNFDSFDVDFSPAGQVLRVTTYRNSGDVNDSKENVFDADGILVRTVYFGSDGTETGRTDLQHDGRGRCTGWLDFDAVGNLLRRCEQRFVSDRIAKMKTQLINGRLVIEREFELRETCW